MHKLNRQSICERQEKPHILFIDNFDSFTFNLVDSLSLLGAEIDVYRNDITANAALEIAREKKSSMIVLSPGPGTPLEAGCTIELIQKSAGKVPLLGVCLGHQAMVVALGGSVGGVREIVHGKKSLLTHQGHDLFKGLPKSFEVGRYHSLAAQHLPECLQAIATCGGDGDDALVMAVAHRTYPMLGVQFHPESILTTYGQTILTNALTLALQFEKQEINMT